MSGFYFSSMPKFKIRRGGVVDDISSPLLAPKTKVSSSSFISLVPEVTSGVPSIPFSTGLVSLSKNCGQPGKRKAATNSKDERFVLGKGMEFVEGFRRTVRGCRDPVSEIEDRTLQDRGASRTPIPHSAASAAIAAALVYKYWTYDFGKAADNPKLTDLLKLAEMYTSQSHVLNYEWYKVLAMKVDKLCSTVGGDDNVDLLRLENKDLWEQFAFS
ncbi:hypothetical protein Fot_56828 [Forsythia ovata]|uniref:Uncharacterized protein n=1 Tax=Forsythia ovata TaxID=205694 RepID=A0ABD1NY13_9LAMI